MFSCGIRTQDLLISTDFLPTQPSSWLVLRDPFESFIAGSTTSSERRCDLRRGLCFRMRIFCLWWRISWWMLKLPTIQYQGRLSCILSFCKSVACLPQNNVTLTSSRLRRMIQLSWHVFKLLVLDVTNWHRAFAFSCILNRHYWTHSKRAFTTRVNWTKLK